jgi:hypothetical protein
MDSQEDPEKNNEEHPADNGEEDEPEDGEMDDEENANNNADNENDDANERNGASNYNNRTAANVKSNKYKVPPKPPTSQILLVLYGTGGKTDPLPLISTSSTGAGSFQPGQADDFKVSTRLLISDSVRWILYYGIRKWFLLPF